MSNLANWLGQTTSTIGTGAISLDGAIDGYALFNDVPDGEYYYTIADGNDRECGIGTKTGSSFSRDTVSAVLVNGSYSDSSPSAISLSGGASVYCTFTKDAFDALSDIDLTALLPRDGSLAMLADLNIDGFAIKNSVDPVDPQDLVTLSYADANYSGGGLTNPVEETITWDAAVSTLLSTDTLEMNVDVLGVTFQNLNGGNASNIQMTPFGINLSGNSSGGFVTLSVNNSGVQIKDNNEPLLGASFDGPDMEFNGNITIGARTGEDSYEEVLRVETRANGSLHAWNVSASDFERVLTESDAGGGLSLLTEENFFGTYRIIRSGTGANINFPDSGQINLVSSSGANLGLNNSGAELQDGNDNSLVMNGSEITLDFDPGGQLHIETSFSELSGDEVRLTHGSAGIVSNSTSFTWNASPDPTELSVTADRLSYIDANGEELLRIDDSANSYRSNLHSFVTHLGSSIVQLDLPNCVFQSTITARGHVSNVVENVAVMSDIPPEVIAEHTETAAQYLLDDTLLSVPTSLILSAEPDSTWFTVGAPGSGADVAWNGFSKLPSNAKTIKLRARAVMTTTGITDPEVRVYICEGNVEQANQRTERIRMRNGIASTTVISSSETFFDVVLRDVGGFPMIACRHQTYADASLDALYLDYIGFGI